MGLDGSLTKLIKEHNKRIRHLFIAYAFPHLGLIHKDANILLKRDSFVTSFITLIKSFK